MMAARKWVILSFLSIGLSAGAQGREPSAGTNLLKNPTFKDGLAGWLPYRAANTPGDGIKAIQDNGADDKNCLCFKGIPKSGSVMQFIGPVQLGATYRLSFMFKCDMATGVAVAEIVYQGGEGKAVRWYQTQDAVWAKSMGITGKYTGWKKCEVLIAVPRDDKLVRISPGISVGDQSPGDTFYIDAVDFAVVTGAGAAPAGQKGGAESGAAARDETETDRQE